MVKVYFNKFFKSNLQSIKFLCHIETITIVVLILFIKINLLPVGFYNPMSHFQISVNYPSNSIPVE